MSREILQNYRNKFVGVKCVIIDEVSVIGSDVLHKINLRLQKITCTHDQPFGNMNIVFCGDFHQLPPYKIPLAVGYPYMITTNIVVEDGIVNGAIGVLKNIELLTKGEHYATLEAQKEPSTSVVTHKQRLRLWIEFPERCRLKAKPYVTFSTSSGRQ
ncbi:unnamed protein product [Hermetia illucens]|uniref:ATP-dependent DNA helicase n=1 Tax=Hermetia illucens TaxID=343691 RepID=A0A7R8URF8_HERIL|nr:unnamed protein product [Hermetia illucens]